MIELIFDVETKKLFSDITTDDPADLGVSIVSVYRRVLNDSREELSGEMKSFWDNESGIVPPISDMWEWFTKADRIIGYNSNHFDIPALRRLYTDDFSSLHHFDMMDAVKKAVGRKLPLDLLAYHTLGQHKIDKGVNAVYYWAKHDEGSLKKLQEYCEADVLITKALYDYGVKNGQLRYIDAFNRPVSFPVDFSYPKKVENPQIELF